MASKGTEIFCKECGKRWNLNEDGTLTALEGETEFTHVPDWFEWERSEVIKQVENGEYSFDYHIDGQTLSISIDDLSLSEKALEAIVVVTEQGYVINSWQY